MRKFLLSFFGIFIFLVIGKVNNAQSVHELYSDLKWRMIGPHRGGRTVGAVGVPKQPNVFYIGVNNGGVWKTTDYGRTWFPIFDDQPTGSIGDIVVAPSNPDVIYVGSGEGIQRPDLSVGDGIYKSTDGGKSWENMGLKNAQQIGGLAIDPANENRLFVAALGHPYGPNEDRGVFRTLDGGKTWEKVLYVDENTGAAEVAIDPQNPNIIYADLWAGRQGPWENGAWDGPQSGLFKSIDGGATWKKLTNGLPTTQQGLKRIGFCIAPSNASRIYATVDADAYSGIYRSDDAGLSWTKIQTDSRLFGRGTDFAEVRVDPKNADIVYTANVVTWKSIDGGKTWKDFRGAPGGDDYHRIWINPDHPEIILIASDQGAIITVNGGETFSSWYNQPTAQFYHVSTDNAFPYNVYGGQQESGSVCIASRGNDGQITFREWHPVGAEEYGYVSADPKNPDIIYGGKLSRYDKRTGQTQNISPQVTRGKYRFLRTAPVLFSPIDSTTLYYAGNVLFKTKNGGHSWQIISPDLSRTAWDVPSTVGIFSANIKNMPRRGVIYTVAPSPIKMDVIWCGTDDGLIHLTKDGGKNWSNVTPNAISSWSKISIIEASHFNIHVAYAAVNRIRVDDMHPHIYKTIDDGKSWTEIINGLPNDPINVIREDPERKGLLFAGSERAVYVSFDDGAHWESLRLNMPATSIRDLVIKNNDLVVGTHGRSFWILDDIAPLRQIQYNNEKSIRLYKPSSAYRIRWNNNTDTPLPQEEPAGQNPPDGAIIDYYLPEDTNSEMVLEILDTKGKLVRRFTSSDTLYNIPAVNIPLYWIRPQQLLSNRKGEHRFVWDLHYAPLNVSPEYPIAAIYKNTAPVPTSPWVMPGDYIVKLKIAGTEQKATLHIKLDPRVKTSTNDIRQQFELSMSCYNNIKAIPDYVSQLQQQLNTAQNPEEVKTKISKLNQLQAGFGHLFNLLQESDMSPTEQMINDKKDLDVQLNSFTTGLQKHNMN